MASGKEIRISITSALNAAGIEATKRQVDQMAKSVGGSFADLAKANKTHWADIKAAWDMGCGAIRKAWAAVTAGLRETFHFETVTTQFKTLVGDMDEARRHMKDLKDLGDTPPFSLDEFARASRAMLVMSDGVLGYKRSLELVGDAAAATGIPIETLGHAVGRMYAFIRDGQPLSRAVMELRNMGVITPEVAQSLQDLQAAGASNADIWAEVEKQLGRYQGAMAETEKTGEGMIGAIQSRWQNVVRAFGVAFHDASKEGLQKLLGKMKELEESGSIEVWAAKVGAALSKVVSAAKVAAGWGQKIARAWSFVWDGAENVGDYWGTLIGTMKNGASFSEANGMAVKAFEQSQRNTVNARIDEEQNGEARMREERDKKAAADKADAETRSAAESARIKAQLEQAEYKKAIAEREKVEADAAKDMERAKIKADKEYFREKFAAMRKAHAEQMRLIDERHAKETKLAEETKRKNEEVQAAARGGMSFGKWARGERDKARDEERAKKKQERVVANAESEMKRIEEQWKRGKAFRDPRTFKRWSELDDFVKANKGFNPAADAAALREKEKLAAAKKTAEEVEKLNKKLDALTI